MRSIAAVLVILSLYLSTVAEPESEPVEPKLFETWSRNFFLQIYPTVSLENPWMKKNLFWDLFLIVLTEIMDIGGIGAENK